MPDTLSPFQQIPWQQPLVPHHSPYKVGELVPYQLSSDDLVVSTLLLCLLLLIVVVAHSHRQLSQQAREFFYPPKERKKHFAEKTGFENYAPLLVVSQLCFMGALLAYGYARSQWHVFFMPLTPWMLLGAYLVCFLAYFLFKQIISSFVHWVFFPKSQQNVWWENALFLFSVESILFFPLLTIFIFIDIPVQKIVVIFAIFLLIVKILQTFKIQRIFFPKFYGCLHLFAYLCALEIVPLMLLVASLTWMTEILTVKN